MRSQQVYQALAHVPNRFALCRITSMALQRLHKASTRPEETISNVLADIDRYRSRRAQPAHTKNTADSELIVHDPVVAPEGPDTNLLINSDLIFAVD